MSGYKYNLRIFLFNIKNIILTGIVLRVPLQKQKYMLEKELNSCSLVIENFIHTHTHKYMKSDGCMHRFSHSGAEHDTCQAWRCMHSYAHNDPPSL